MITIIIAGGSGTRLWPLSTPDKPKQFLSIDATGKSLLGKTYERVREFSQATYVVTSAPIAEETKRQLPEIADNIVVEPARKGVANALYLGIRRLLRDGHHDDEPVFILWSDHLIRDTETFERTVREAEVAVQEGAKLVQFGIIPTYPSNQLGYIKKGGNQHGSNVYAIESWKYQPDQETANTWFESGQYLWNAGYFVSTVQYIMGEIKRESPESYAEYQAIVEADEGEIEEVYTHQEGAILDHVLSEKMKGAHVVACTFDWIDIGNYQDLYAVSAHDADENSIRGTARVFNVNNSYIANMTSIPVAVIGLNNVAVVVTDEGVVVVDKSQSRSVGDVAKQIQTS